MFYLAGIINPVISPKIGEKMNFISMPGGYAYVLRLFISNFIKIGFVVGAVVFLFMLIWGGIEYITAGGEKDKVTNSGKRITNALIGIAILLSVYALSKLLNLVFGINILKLDIPVIL